MSTNSFYRNYSRVDALPTTPGPIGNTFGNFGAGFMAVGRSVSEIVDPNSTGPGGLPIQVGDFQPAYRMSFGNELNIGPVRFYGLIDVSRGGNAISLTDLYFGTAPGSLSTAIRRWKRSDSIAIAEALDRVRRGCVVRESPSALGDVDDANALVCVHARPYHQRQALIHRL